MRAAFASALLFAILLVAPFTTLARYLGHDLR
jgi:hypothetical protein